MAKLYISNQAGGDQLVVEYDARKGLSQRAIRYAQRIEHGSFGGVRIESDDSAVQEAARTEFDQIEADNEDAEYEGVE